MKTLRSLRLLAVAALLPAALCHAAESAAPKLGHNGPACVMTDDYFAEQVWPKVAVRSCLECHKAGGDAEDSKLVLEDPAKDPSGALERNREAFLKLALMRKNEQSRLLLKATGGLSHGGEEVLKAGSVPFGVLAEFVRRAGGLPLAVTVKPKVDTSHFFDGVSMIDHRRLLRRATLSLAGRLPTAAELDSVMKQGLPAMRTVLQEVMKEEAFYDRLAEAFNDILLIRGFDGNAEQVIVSYDNSSHTRGWYSKWDLTHIADKNERARVGYKLADDYREGFKREPLELIKYIVRHDRAFTEIITAEYSMQTPYTARGYGDFEELAREFHDLEDPFDFIPARLPALTSRQGARAAQPSETGRYPHAGVLASFQYLRRYPTTETNRNRLRARMFYQQFLGVDVLELAARVKDAAAVTARFETPTTQASECVVCHRTLDPVAGIFQDYYDFDGAYGPRKAGWYKDIFAPGFEGEDLPPEQKWRAIPWLAERAAKDPRFANTMVEHVYYILTGRKVLLAPKGLDDPLYEAKRVAYEAQHAEVERIAAKLVEAKFNLKEAFQQWVVSPFYRAENMETTGLTPQRRAELADIGIAHMLSPEQLERKIKAVFGKSWGRLTRDYAMLYGGIDAQEVTERAADPSGAMGAMQRSMAVEVACKNVALDFSLDPDQRRLFPAIEPDVLPGESPEADQRIRQAIAHLHDVVLGRYDAPSDPEAERTYQLFAGVIADARERKPGADELYECRAGAKAATTDPHYTVRAWRSVVTYLLRQRDFLYE